MTFSSFNLAERELPMAHVFVKEFHEPICQRHIGHSFCKDVYKNDGCSD